MSVLYTNYIFNLLRAILLIKSWLRPENWWLHIYH